MNIKELLSALEKFAPLPLQDGYDNSGLQIGLTEVELTGALLCLDVTEKVVDEAIENNCNLIISHHPLIFKANKSITGANYIERCIIKAIKNDITIYSIHTNLDNAHNGVSYKMAEKLCLKNIKTLIPKEDSLVKIAVYVPNEYAEAVRAEIFKMGSGSIGNYSSCSYNVEGYGTFCASEKANAFVGKVNELHTEKEVKIEVIETQYNINRVISAIKKVHPYEEPAIDIYDIRNINENVGAGIVGNLKEELTTEKFISLLKEKFNLCCIKCNNSNKKSIVKVAMCGGSGAFTIDRAISVGADCIVTSDIKYHDYFGREDILIVDIGHYESEQYTMELMKEIIESNIKKEKRIIISKINTNPIKYL